MTWVGHVESFDIFVFIPKQNKQHIFNESGFWEVTFMIESLPARIICAQQRPCLTRTMQKVRPCSSGLVAEYWPLTWVLDGAGTSSESFQGAVRRKRVVSAAAK